MIIARSGRRFWWHASERGLTGMDMIIEQSGEIEAEGPDEVIA
jgi:hypothetical protein